MSDLHITVNKAEPDGVSPLLTAIVDDLTNSGAKLVYADWLEEHGDTTRADFLRRYVEAFKTMKVEDFPSLDIAPPEWVRMTGATLVRAIADQGLSEDRDKLLKLAMPALLYEAAENDSAGFASDDQIPLGGTKMWGRPDLPPGAIWPKQKDCNSFYMPDSGIEPETNCSFVAQLNFADFQGTQASRFMPASGLLSIFSCAEIESIGMVEGYVIYTPDTSNLVRLDPPADLHPDTAFSEQDEANAMYGARKLTLSETLELPSPGGESPFDVLKMGYSDERYDKIFQVKEDAKAGELDSILGFTRPTSGDDPLPGAEWCKLICIENSIEMKLHFCIKTSDLQAANFSNVALAWVDFD